MTAVPTVSGGCNPCREEDLPGTECVRPGGSGFPEAHQMTARILQLSIKSRTPGEFGLPKRAVTELGVTARGAEGDYNDYRTRSLDGDPDQAILVITEEVLTGLRSEGWPVAPGDLGENITLAGVAESSLRPGTRLLLGEVSLEITRRCDPCTELHSLPYVGRTRGVEFVKTMVDRRGWYARVLTAGAVRLETPVQVASAPPASPPG
jgi:MOSC domain-containing protein YiiM